MFKRSQIERAIAQTVGNAYGAHGPIPAHIRLNLKRLRDADLKIGITDERLDEGLRRYAFVPQGPGKRGVDTSYSDADAFILLIGYRLLTSGFPQGTVVRLMRELGGRLATLFLEMTARSRESELRFLVLVNGAGSALVWRRTDAGGSEMENMCEASELQDLCTHLAGLGKPIVVLELTSAAAELTEQLSLAPALKRGRSRG